MRSLAILAIFLGVSTAFGGESKFIFVDRMPEARGALERTLTHQDERGGLRIVQEVFVEDYEHALIQTYVMAGHCPNETLDGDPEKGSYRATSPKIPTSPKIYVTAIKYLPKKPATFAVAGLHDLYKDVYVVDRDGKIRLYEDVAPQSMLELSEAFKPACVLI